MEQSTSQPRTSLEVARTLKPNEGIARQPLLTSPFRFLPPEITGVIAFDLLELEGSPFQFAQVCSSTRAAILGCKQLWSNIFIYSSSSKDIKRMKRIWKVDIPLGSLSCSSIEWLRVLLARSDPCPLTITLWEPKYIVKLMQELAPVSKRIERMLIISKHDWGSDYPGFDLKNLQRLVLYLPIYENRSVKNLLDQLPSNLNTCFKLSVSAAWASLQGISSHHALSGLAHVEILDHSTLFRDAHSPNIVFSALQSLRIENLPYFFKLRLPLLQKLSVKGYDEDFRVKTANEDFTLFLEDIPETISHLEIEDVVIAARTRQAKLLPNLRVFKMSGDLDIDSGKTPKLLAPQLHELTISDGDHHETFRMFDGSNLYTVFFWGDGVLEEISIKRLHLINTHKPDLSSILLDPTFLPELTFVEVRDTNGLMDRDSLETLRHDFSLHRPSVQLLIS